MADHIGLPLESWARQVLRQASGLPSLRCRIRPAEDPGAGEILLLVRLRAEERKRFERAASDAGLTLAGWVRSVLAGAADGAETRRRS